MIGKALNRRAVVALIVLSVLAGCRVIPKAPPQVEAAVVDVTEGELPSDRNRHRIALLVPLTGANAQVGQSLANATTLALLDTNNQTVRITTYDTAEGVEAAAQRALADGNRLILGPLNGEEAGAISAVARPARVPLLSYSDDLSISADDVFVLGTATDSAIDRVVRYAAAQGLTRFAIMAPQGEVGDAALRAFEEAVGASGGSVAARERYVSGNGSALTVAQRLRARGGFDAVLIADSARAASQIAPQLKRVGAATPRILGTDAWSGETVIGSTPALRGAWFAAVSDTRFRQFADSYQGRFSARPYRLSTMGYDSVLLTIRIARDWRVGRPFPVERLRDSSGFLGLDGPFRFGEGGTIERALEVREARAGGVNIVSPAPDRFED